MKLKSIAREKAFKMLYQAEMTNFKPDRLIKQFWELDEEKNEKVKLLANKLFRLVIDKKGYADDIISKYLKEGWTFERLTETVKNTLRLGIAELFNTETPVYAILDEYTTLAKKYEDEKAASFVNGVLEKIRKDFNIERG
ncbi:N utilization substance protein B [Deferribacter desulfuricans SSM1]|uniref:Transcription antitermination protein NusB n=1 Tax=Deferribacter desulfuricans (strain DSM 14783 / JCM 11476 / NBRC 101012 / SSM1) TaxID=639282 RepID=D3PD96_DEFDS|nr:transcription antitermination factor NusB [Deferribacter desulfuricans]BAI80569.1 N utilization substance protein B [Deferribacter desulfuricans SSM1]